MEKYNKTENKGGFEYTKLDTFSETIYMVKLAADPKAFIRQDESLDVVLTFIDTSRFKGHMDLWVDARVLRAHSERAMKFRKGDIVQLRSKLRFRLNNNGTIRGKMFDAYVSSFVNTSERTPVEPQKPNTEFANVDDAPDFE